MARFHYWIFTVTWTVLLAALHEAQARPIGDARVPQAIGQPFDRLVPAEAEVLGARVADRPATLPPTELRLGGWRGIHGALTWTADKRHPSGYHESGIARKPAAQAPLAAKLYFDCHDALRAERKRRYEV